ncbi:hypothetical protein C8R45DRAFT_1214738 [Mycena sanguinolenta]|nr:hypothetical protein C8R45DRAFT_1214738 [Mycena sanguinolenta]
MSSHCLFLPRRPDARPLVAPPHLICATSLGTHSPPPHFLSPPRPSSSLSALRSPRPRSLFVRPLVVTHSHPTATSFFSLLASLLRPPFDARARSQSNTQSPSADTPRTRRTWRASI